MTISFILEVGKLTCQEKERRKVLATNTFLNSISTEDTFKIIEGKAMELWLIIINQNSQKISFIKANGIKE